ncbi:hypothetical protein AgCh_033858 [Apium graveolens]
MASTIEQFRELEFMTIEETVGTLKAHEERMRGQPENTGGQLLLTEEKRSKREKDEGKLLLTREEWLKRKNNGGQRTRRGTNDYRSRDGGRTSRDKSRIRCFNCDAYEHYASECRKPRRDKDEKEEVNMVQMQDDEPALLLTEKDETVMLLNEEKVVPILNTVGEGKHIESNLWYRDNGASNQMSGKCTKFAELDERVSGQVKFDDGFVVHIKGKSSIILGHVNFKALTLMSAADMARGLPHITQPWEVCSGCLMSKQTRKQSPTQATYSTKQILELVHGDIHGPIAPTTAAGTSIEEEPDTPHSDSSNAENTPNSQQSNIHMASSKYEAEITRYKCPSDIYRRTEEAELEDDELYLMGIEEPATYHQAVEESN